jgi:hypothetical protein
MTGPDLIEIESSEEQVAEVFEIKSDLLAKKVAKAIGGLIQAVSGSSVVIPQQSLEDTEHTPLQLPPDKLYHFFASHKVTVSVINRQVYPAACHVCDSFAYLLSLVGHLNR